MTENSVNLLDIQLFLNLVTQNGPSEVQPPPPTQPQPPQQTQTQPQPMTAANKRITASSNVNTHNQLTVPPMENGLDYRGHHSISSSNQIPSSSSSTSIQQNSGSASNNIRFRP